MTMEDLEARLEKLEKRCNRQQKTIRTLKKGVQVLADTEAIKKLQRAYGYYLEHWMAEEVIDCFSDGPDVYIKLYEGTYLGKEGIRRYFDRERSNEYLHQVMQLCGVVTVDPDGVNARGRWYSYGACAVTLGKGVRQYFMNGIYEMGYIKEHGVWKIKDLEYCLCYAAPPNTGWVKPERIAALTPEDRLNPPPPDIPPDEFDSKYPSGYIMPFHFKHPVTGRPSGEAQHNASLDLPKRRIQ